MILISFSVAWGCLRCELICCVLIVLCLRFEFVVFIYLGLMLWVCVGLRLVTWLLFSWLFLAYSICVDCVAVACS